MESDICVCFTSALLYHSHWYVVRSRDLPKIHNFTAPAHLGGAPSKVLIIPVRASFSLIN